MSDMVMEEASVVEEGAGVFPGDGETREDEELGCGEQLDGSDGENMEEDAAAADEAVAEGNEDGSVAVEQDWLFIFVVIDIIAWVAVEAIPISWEKRANLCSCAMSITHGIKAGLGSFHELAARLPCAWDVPNSAGEVRTMQMSLAYFVVDFVHICATTREVPYLLHHCGTSTYMVWSLVDGRSAVSCMALMFFGELTSPFLNAWTAAREVSETSELALLVFNWVRTPFTVVYFIIRMVLGPIGVAMVAHGVYHATALSAGMRGTFIFIMFLGVYGSYSWGFDLLGQYRDAKAAKQLKGGAAKKDAAPASAPVAGGKHAKTN